MNSGHIVKRKAYRKLWEDMLELSSQEVPYGIFEAGACSKEDARRMHFNFNASVFGKTG